MIKKIAHFGDYHIHNDKWQDRYEIGNKYIYDKLTEEKPDRILIAGDLFESFIVISNEAKIFAGDFLNKLSDIAPIIIVPGNHDIRKKDLKRKNSVETVIDLIHNKNITYFGKSGFYNDDNVVWVNHSHLEKDINPWDDTTYKKDNTKTYIDIWHDPINGCMTDNGFEMKSKSYRNVSDFKGDFGMFADIHKFQYLNKTKTIAYCSSTFQQTMGEDVDEHGFLLWDIINKKSEFVIVPDEYKLITFRTTENFDYDNINFDHVLATNKSTFRVIWKDYSSNINNENEDKIKKYFIDKWNKKEITFEKQRIYTNVASTQKLTESIDISDKTVQQDIFREYLLSNKYDETFIEEILAIDNIIDGRLELSPKINDIEWSIDKLWVDNFKSYDNFELDFSMLPKGVIIQAGGENQQGKTTILDAITYVSHGSTLATNKLGGAQREKYGDNRYINNKRLLDYCEGGMVIDVNGNKYTLLRRTERKLAKDKSISGVSTNIEYYDGTEVIEENKLRGERKTETQLMLDSIIGDFDDFIRLTLTNSENLNHLISLDRATFIDSVIRDAGYDIFEKKLAEFKEYKKEISTNKIDINLNDAEEEVSGLKDLLKTHKIDHDNVKIEINDINEKLKEINNERDIEIKKLHKIDDDIARIDIKAATNKIEEYKSTIDINLNQQNINSVKSKGLKQSYKSDELESYLKEIKKIDDDVLNLKLKTSQEDTKIEKEKGNIVRVDDKVKQLKQKEIDTQKSKLTVINNDIEKINEELEDAIEEKIREYSDKKKTDEFEVRTLTIELNTIKEKGSDLKKQITLLEESKICPTCNREYDENHQENIDLKVKELNDEITKLLEKGKISEKKLEDCKKQVESSQHMIDDLNLDTYDTDDILEIKESVEKRLKEKQLEIVLIDTICGEIRVDNFVNVPELEININKGIKIKDASKQSIIDIEDNIKSIKQSIKDKGIEKSDIQDKVYIIEQDKNEVKMYETLMQENKELSLKIENIKLTIENAKTKIDKYYDQLKYIDENAIIEERISELNESIKEQNSNKDDLNENLAEIMKEASVTKTTIVDIQNNIKKYQEQVKRDELLKEYGKAIHRDGIPSYMLLKHRDLINVEMEDLLSNVDFNVYFDEYLDLKMFNKLFPNAIQSSLTGSGMERTFTAVVLKIALRNINTKSKPNILLLDEVMGKLKGQSVDKFNFLLNTLKTKIDKILIIEHTHNIDYDILISVEKDKNGVSSLNIES